MYEAIAEDGAAGDLSVESEGVFVARDSEGVRKRCVYDFPGSSEECGKGGVFTRESPAEVFSALEVSEAVHEEDSPEQ